MPSPTWDEYLAAASAHLAALRRSAEQGGPPPAPPTHPIDLIPEDRRLEAHELALGYDKLAEEVIGLMSVIERRRFSSPRRGPHREYGPARYIDTPV
jgi:hypothetical protein